MDLQKRVAGILMRPQQEWTVIAAETDDVAGIYRRYVLVLAAIPAVAIALGLAARFRLISGISAGVSTYISAAIAPILGALVVERLAPKFDSTATTVQALKLVAYASTPIWVAGAAYLVLVLTPLTVLAALYSVYLAYLGMPILLKTPANKVVPFMVVTILTLLVLNIVIGAVLGAGGMPRYGF
jgi:hypothetical protein